ncbi:MAG: pantetheine-phosphate adenylyltransferase [Proteobacteria bacterium]|nr:MAG: pantetheine-phosphate adenylyltransferase [Pseudomonadota bacterium]
MNKAIYAGSFDPVTNGHLWLIKKAASIFDTLVVAVGDNPYKSYSFNIDERIAMLKNVLADCPNVEIGQFSGEFLVNYARKINAQYIVRGIRNVQDYEFERTLRYVNSDVCQDVETIFLMPPRDFAEVSSSLIKGFVGTDGWQAIVAKYVPPLVVDELVKQFTKEKNYDSK